MNYLIAPKKETSKTATITLSSGWLYLLALVLSVLKWQGVITWSWWLVLAPIWVPWLLVALSLSVIGLTVLAWLLVLIGKNKEK